MKVLLTGATGFIGRKLSKELLKKGHSLIVFGRATEEKFRAKFDLPCEYYEWKNQGSRLPSVEHIAKSDAIIHLAGEPVTGKRWSDEKKKRILNSRVKVTENLVKAIQSTEDRPKIFLSASAIGYYGDKGAKEIVESAPVGTDFLARVCSDWEYASKPIEKLGVRRGLLRIGIVLGTGGGILNTIEPIFQRGLGGKLGDGNQWMSWIHIDDVVGAFLHALENRIDGPINATAPHPVRNSRFTKELAEILKRPAFFHAPKIAIKTAIGEMSAVALTSCRALPGVLIESGYDFKYKTLDEAFHNLYSWKNSPNENLYEMEQWVNSAPQEASRFFDDKGNIKKITPPWVTAHNGGTIKLHGLSVKWNHTHTFEELAGGTLMKDKIVYQVPFSLLGQMVAQPLVQGDVEKIFSYRKKVISNLLNRSTQPL